MKAIAALLFCWALLFLNASAGLGLSWRVALSTALVAGVLFAAMQATRVDGWRLVWILFALDGGIGVLNIAVEALFFQVMPVPTTLRFLARGLTVASAACFAMVWIAGRLRPGPDATTRGDVPSVAHG